MKQLASIAVIVIAIGCVWWAYSTYSAANPPVPAGAAAVTQLKAQPPKKFPSGEAIEGLWLGTLKNVPNAGDMRMLVNIRTEADGSFSATFDSIDQGARGIPIDTVDVNGDAIKLKTKTIGGEYVGTHSASGISGTWTQKGFSAPLTLQHVTEAPAMATPAAHTEIAVDPAILDQYVGQYALAPNFSVSITREGNQLMQQATGQGRCEIYPEAPDHFFLKLVDAQYEFKRDASGKVTELILHQGKVSAPGKRIR